MYVLYVCSSKNIIGLISIHQEFCHIGNGGPTITLILRKIKETEGKIRKIVKFRQSRRGFRGGVTFDLQVMLINFSNERQDIKRVNLVERNEPGQMMKNFKTITVFKSNMHLQWFRFPKLYTFQLMMGDFSSRKFTKMRFSGKQQFTHVIWVNKNYLRYRYSNERRGAKPRNVAENFNFQE